MEIIFGLAVLSLLVYAIRIQDDLEAAKEEHREDYRDLDSELTALKWAVNEILTELELEELLIEERDDTQQRPEMKVISRVPRVPRITWENDDG